MEMKKSNVFSNSLLNVVIITGLMVHLLSGFLFAQDVNHPYPRAGVFHFGRPAPAEWYAKFDLVIIRSQRSSLASAIKAINPNTLVSSTLDWNAGAGLDPREHGDWIVRTSTGEKVTIYGASNVFTFDFSDFCPRLPQYDNKRYNEYLPEYLLSVHHLNVFDGITTDGLWYTPREAEKVYHDIDLDRNGINDYDEHGKSWVDAKWQEGVDKVVSTLRQIMPADKFLIINSGILHDFQIENSNGCIAENHGPMYSWNWARGRFDLWYQKSRRPHLLFYDGRGRHKKRFDQMRFELATICYSDGYFSFSEEGNHNYDMYYDEYDLDLGFPTGPMQRLTNTGDWGEGIWVRFFEKGAVIVNMDRNPATVTDAQLRSLSFYNGPYYRFRGGQDPETNNGQLFDSITLNGELWSSKGDYVGDAIFLVKQPTTVVSEIIVDSDNEGTSPGSYPAEYTGKWNKTNDNVDDAWCLSYKAYKDAYALAYTTPGKGENYATFKPTINVAGNYSVYEWHGDKTDLTLSGRVPVEIHHANGTATKFVDQTSNHGKWNYLGTYYFKPNMNLYVRISNNTSSGSVVADAVKFVYSGSDGSIDDIPPNPPRGLDSDNQTENSIRLVWSAPEPASDGDGASNYLVYRDGNLVKNTSLTNYLDAGLQPNTTYQYEVFSLDDAGNRSYSPASASFSTLNETTPPQILSVEALSKTTVEVKFNEALDEVSAQDVNNYSIDKNIVIHQAVLQDDQLTVRLTTSEHIVGELYTLTAANIKDLAQNASGPLSMQYVGVANPIIISVAADNQYELYVNGNFLGSGNDWRVAQTYFVSPNIENILIAIKAMNSGDAAGLVAEIKIDDRIFVSNTTWKVSKSETAGWNTLDFDDSQWQNATSYGLHGSAQPWANYHDVQGISTTNNVEWIWSDDTSDLEIFLRYLIPLSGDNSPPSPPVGVRVFKIR